ncbi:aspartate ammonia-lyase, partial [Candidatus Woesearchaeota archaeon]|nr:aspartate ammonia-lyase [Candidatus Woesearchaeota archaeon]
MRLEKDSLGEKEIPDSAYYGIHTSRSLENFNAAGEIFPIELIRAMVKLKIACARANHSLGLLEINKASAIEQAGKKILSGELVGGFNGGINEEFENQFCIDAFQSGSGTSSNMNINEVIANLACEILGGKKGDKTIIHPNDHVNMGQSTNNIVPSAIRMVSFEKSKALIDAAAGLWSALGSKASEFSHIFKSARTHLQDAVPITLGREFGAYARAIEKDIERLKEARKNLLELGVGGNAVGTGINTKKGFRAEIMKALKEITGTEFQIPKDGIEITQFHTDIAHLSAAVKLLAADILKIANDLRLLASGPNTAIGEIILPAVEPGSSIMPG